MSKSSNSGFFDSVQSVVSKYPLDVSATSCCLVEGRNEEMVSASPSAPPLSQPPTLILKSPFAPNISKENWDSHAGHIQDEGGPPSAPPNADITDHFQEEVNLSNLNLNGDHVGDEVGLLSTIPKVDNTGHSKDEEGNLRNLHLTEETSASYADMTKIYTEIAAVRSNVGRNVTAGGNISTDRKSESPTDEEGFRLVQNRKKRAGNIVGSRKAKENEKLRGAVQVADIYLGNCNLEVTPESIVDYIRNEMNIEVQNCEPLESRNRNCKSFKIALKTIDRPKLLVPEVWPEGIVCRKFFNPRRK